MNTLQSVDVMRSFMEARKAGCQKNGGRSCKAVSLKRMLSQSLLTRFIPSQNGKSLLKNFLSFHDLANFVTFST